MFSRFASTSLHREPLAAAMQNWSRRGAADVRKHSAAFLLTISIGSSTICSAVLQSGFRIYLQEGLDACQNRVKLRALDVKHCGLLLKKDLFL
jgi:hypothetical protein